MNLNPQLFLFQLVAIPQSHAATKVVQLNGILNLEVSTNYIIVVNIGIFLKHPFQLLCFSIQEIESGVLNIDPQNQILNSSIRVKVQKVQ